MSPRASGRSFINAVANLQAGLLLVAGCMAAPAAAATITASVDLPAFVGVQQPGVTKSTTFDLGVEFSEIESYGIVARGTATLGRETIEDINEGFPTAVDFPGNLVVRLLPSVSLSSSFPSIFLTSDRNEWRVPVTNAVAGFVAPPELRSGRGAIETTFSTVTSYIGTIRVLGRSRQPTAEFTGFTFFVTGTQVPEPATAAALLAGLACVAKWRR